MDFFSYQTEEIEGFRVDLNPKIFSLGTFGNIWGGKGNKLF